MNPLDKADGAETGGNVEGGGERGDQVWPMHDQTLERRIRSSSNRRCAKSLVGTPNYIAPEILRRQGECFSSYFVRGN